MVDTPATKKLSCAEFEAAESPIDTKYFGISSARIILRKACSDIQGQKDLVNFARGFEFATIINHANDPFNNYWLGEKTNAFLTDINIQLSKKVTAITKSDEHFLTVSDNFPQDQRIIQIAQASFEFSRFLNDPYLPLDKAKGVYADITNNAFARAGRFFIVHKIAEAVSGFLLFSINEPSSSAVIELIAIDANQRGRGIGRSLIRSMEHYLGEKSIGTIQVGTQLDNTVALKFYTMNGFSYLEQNSVYHYWPSRNSNDNSSTS